MRSFYIYVSQYSFDYEIPEGSMYTVSDLYDAIMARLDETDIFVEGIDPNRDDIDWGDLSDKDIHQCGIDFIDIDRKSDSSISVYDIIDDVIHELGFTIYGDDYESVPYYGIENDVARFYGVSVDELIDMLEDAEYTVADSLH